MRRIQTIVTPTGPVNVVRPVADQLLRNNVISGTLDGSLHAADAATVKAAMMSLGVCDFCSAIGPSHVVEMPDFEFPGVPGAMSEGAWATCDTCWDLIQGRQKKRLLDRAIEKMSFSKFTRPAIAEMHDRFWQLYQKKQNAASAVRVLSSFVEDTLEGYRPAYAFTQRDRRVDAIARLTGLSPAKVEAMVRGETDDEITKKVLAYSEKWGSAESIRSLTDALAGAGPRKPLANVVPHWQRAVDAKFEAIGTIGKTLQQIELSETFQQDDAVDLKDPRAVQDLMRRTSKARELRRLGFDSDIKVLRVAETYSFNAETIAAIREAAASLPVDAPLSSVEAPNTGAGWFWFSEPIPIPVTAELRRATWEEADALLWSWDTTGGRVLEVDLTDLLASVPESERQVFFGRLSLAGIHASCKDIKESDIAWVGTELRKLGVTGEMFEKATRVVEERVTSLRFSAYVTPKSGSMKGRLLPGTRWYWPLEMSFADMVTYNRDLHRRDYGEGGERLSDSISGAVAGEEDTLAVVRDLSLFFIMACVWFRQTVPGSPKKRVEPVLTKEDGHVERHARKRMQREHGLTEPPKVHVIALRKSARVEVEGSEETPERREGARNYNCRWIVKGHPRMQVCGPGRKDRKLIWIEAHPAGPEDKPLRVRERVYAVVR